jgi:hypothetical protein
MEPDQELSADRRPIDNRHPPNRRVEMASSPTAMWSGVNGGARLSLVSFVPHIRGWWRAASRRPRDRWRPPTALPSVTMPAVPAPPTRGAAVVTSAAVKRWESTLVADIERFKRYPAEARARDERGTAQVAFTIDRDGWVRASCAEGSQSGADGSALTSSANNPK